MFRVELENGHIVSLIYLENAHYIKLLPGDKVKLEMSLRFVKSKNYL
jgi:translation initiation factor IF-1